jgi:CheY-like chemotaxis protein
MMEIVKLECVLLVDDDEATNFINRRIITLSGLPAKIEVAINGNEALDFLRQSGQFKNQDSKQPGLILLDINMPGMNGWEFLEEYKKLPATQKEKIIIAMLTTSMNPEDEQKSKGYSEVAIFLRKPLTIANVKDLVASYFTG